MPAPASERSRGGRRTLAAWLGLGKGAAAVSWRTGLAAAAVLVAILAVRAWQAGRLEHDSAWEITSLEGAPVVDDRDLTGALRLRPGDWVRTDERSRARVTAPDVGRVDVGPATDVRLLATAAQEHRIELARGELHAFIWAPPRLFFVETPSGVAEDLGCEYHLAVDRQGNGALEVRLGFVSFERDGREVIVPEGARCDLRAGLGPGTPHARNAATVLRRALEELDFAGPDAARALDRVLEVATADDAVTLWHLVPRTGMAERESVVDRLAALVELPAGVSREGALALDQAMLESWWVAIYPDWTIWH